MREPFEQTLFLGRGLISDDTEHAAVLARSLIDERVDASRFARRFAARLGALVVACAAACSRQRGPLPASTALDELVSTYARVRRDDTEPFAGILADMRPALARGLGMAAYARTLGCGEAVTGFVMHTVPVAVYAWLSHAGDFRRAITEVVRCGGDTDSVAAITGAIVGAGLGPAGIPPGWTSRTLEFPGTIARLRRLARRLADPHAKPGALARLAEAAWWPAMLLRNIAMFALLIGVLVQRSALVLLHR